MFELVSQIVIGVSVILLIVSLIIRNHFERQSAILCVTAIMLLIAAICLLAFSGTAPHIVDDQYMPISYP